MLCQAADGLRFPASSLWKVFEVGQVLVSARGLFVDFQVIQANKIDFDAVQHTHYPFSVTFIEIDTGNRRGKFYPDRRYAQADYLPFFEEKLRR